MITLLFMPFFLVSRFSVDVSSWFYGPEYSYHVTVSLADKETEDTALTLVSNLKCRPQVPDTLSCRLETTTVTVMAKDLLNFDEDYLCDWELEEEPFELKFYESGINKVVVSNSTKPKKIHMIRAIADQLNFGVDLKRLPFGVQDVVERSYIGECESMFSYFRFDGRSEIRRKNSSLQIIPMMAYDGPDTILNIYKSRKLDRCTYKNDYFFGSNELQPNPPGHIVTKVLQSKSIMLIQETEYTARVENIILVTNTQQQKNVTLFEINELMYTSVEAATTEMPVISDPVEIDITLAPQ